MIVSVIVPFYKEIDLIGRAVRSVLSQNTYGYDVDFDVVIGNDGDFSSEEIFSAIDPSLREKVRVEKNTGIKGPGGARNCALECAIGECLTFLDADDYWLPGKVSMQLEKYSSGYNFIATAYKFENGTTLHPPAVRNGRSLKVFKQLGIGTSSVMISRSLLADTRFRNIRFGQDIDLWHRLSIKPNFCYANVPECFVVYSTAGSTRNKFEQASYFWKVLSANNLPIFEKLDSFLRYGLRGVWNHFIR